MPGVVGWFGRLLKYLVLTVLLLVLVVALAWGFLSRRMPALRPWHRFSPPSEFTAANLKPTTTLSEYLAHETAVFREVGDNVERGFTPGPRDVLERYAPDSPVNPSKFKVNWNRTYELTPAAPVGGALLIHGMTDSPYSMRTVARRLADSGYYCLALRMPGHGTVPGGLTTARWQDWAAAVRVGVRHVREKVGEGKPLLLVGYSNGGALALDYALDALDDQSLARPDRLVLVSPMIGVTPAAGLSRVISLLQGVPYFERAAWTSVTHEYNPFKYNSFPAAAGQESFRLTRELERKLGSAQASGKLRALPPVLTFQSLVDATVVANAVFWRVYERLPANGSELVIFGLDRRSNVRPFLPPEIDDYYRRLSTLANRPYSVSLVTNVTDSTADVAEWRLVAGASQPTVRSLGLAWPQGVFSLSHIALPFPVDDPLYGLEPNSQESFGLRIGHLQARGERGVLTVSPDDMLRLACNPFFPYLERKLKDWLGKGAEVTPAAPATVSP